MTATAPGAIRWRCRRGMRELDFLLGDWLDRCWGRAAPGERAMFVQLLEQPDPQLAEWLLQGARPADRGLAALVDAMLHGRD
jgi:antitoxin CptB